MIANHNHILFKDSLDFINFYKCKKLFKRKYYDTLSKNQKYHRVGPKYDFEKALLYAEVTYSMLGIIYTLCKNIPNKKFCIINMGVAGVLVIELT